MKNRLGAALFLPLLTAVLLYPQGRRLLFEKEPPAFFVEISGGVRVSLGEGFTHQGIHQFSDGMTLGGVIEMTEHFPLDYSGPLDLLDRPLQDGEELHLFITPLKTFEIQSGWMTAGTRVALGICLQADRMEQRDWEYLPGIGEKLARTIELDRQKNGEFGDLSSLQRVRGIGPKRISTWEEFFCPPQPSEYK